ncbi:MAG: aromatic ring-hydroxylating dioxygenase subunit alpha [Pseudomonadota bacterium]|nr:aromatic ring-hydroxylating dioxygenase subunit alpha [Pseudomonadota bacterium]
MAEPPDLLDPAHYEGVRLPAADAVPLPNWCYTSDDWYRLEVERIFHKSWVYVGHGSRIPKAGTYFTLDVAGAPVLLIRGDDGQVRAFHNSCRHRGSRIAWGEGSCKSLTCPYHSWTYARNGNLIATPLVDEDAHLRHAELGLLPVRLEQWAGFLFVNFDNSAAPLADWLGDLPETCKSYRPETLVCTRRKVFEGVKANWKLHFENFNDSLHIPFVHGGSLNRQPVSGRLRRTHEEFKGQCVVHFTQHKGSRGLLEGESGFSSIQSLEGRYQEGTWYPCILPATMMAWTIDCMFLFELWPTGPVSVNVAINSFFPEDRTRRHDFDELAEKYYRRLDVILPEDNEAVEAQQQGLYSPMTASAKFTHMETLCHAFDNWVLDMVLN